MDFVEFVIRMLLVFRGLLGPAVIGLIINQQRGVSQDSLADWAALSAFYFLGTLIGSAFFSGAMQAWGVILWGYDNLHRYFVAWQFMGFAGWSFVASGFVHLDIIWILFGILTLTVQQICLRAMNPYSKFSILEELDEPRRRINEYAKRFPYY